MDQKFDCLDSLEKKVLVELVRLVQKQRLRGTVGSWKDFLNLYDKKFGSSVSDPARRSNVELSSFLKTFNKENDLKFIEKALQSLMNRNLVEQSKKIIPADESPEQVLETEKAMLLLHHIPNSVPSEELHRVVPGECTIEVRVKRYKPKKKRRIHYCAVAIYSNPQEADQAFENVNGKPEKDSAGLRQKLVEFQFDAGITIELYVRKMARDDDTADQVLTKKRVFQGKKNSGGSKKLKTEQEIKEEISGESKKLKTEQEIKEEISGESKKQKTEQETKEEISGESKKLKTVQETKEVISGESTKLKTEQETKEEISGESTKLKTEQEIKEEISDESKKLKTDHETKEENMVDESKKLKTDQETKEENMVDSNQSNCDDHLKEIERLRQEVSENDFQISMHDKIISEPGKKVKKTKKRNKKKKLKTEQETKEEILGESKKMKTVQETKEEISGESTKLKTEQEIKKEISDESKKLKTEQETKEENMVDSNQSNCDDHLKEIERLRQEVSENDFQISTQDKIISEPGKKVKKTKKRNKKKKQN